MAARRFPKTNGVARPDWGDGVCSRNSIAYNPDTGKVCRPNIPRLTTNRIPRLNWRLELFHTFAEPQLKMMYDASHPNPNNTGYYCVGTGGRLESWDTWSSARGWTKTVPAKKSYLGKDIPYYTLPKTGSTTPLADKIFLLSCVCHGNEVDGIDGVFKAMEILTTNSRFQSFRDEWTVVFFPFLNPDGWSSNLRNLAHVGPNGMTVNLNRNWDWYWNEYVETGAESKGSAPHSENEAQVLLDHHTAVEAAGGRYGVVLDMHATEAFGCRYYTRDRLNQKISLARDAGGEIPDAWVTQHLQEHLWRMDRSICIKRYLETANGKAYYTRMLKSRYDPKLHSYFSSLGAYSCVVEEAKVAEVQTGAETIASACNFRLDHILNTAAAVTEENWTYDDAILVEAPTENVLPNSRWNTWNYGENRPSYWNYRRAVIEREPSFFEDPAGCSLKMTSALTIETAGGSEYSSCTPVASYSTDGLLTYYDNLAAVLSYGKILWFPTAGKEAEEYTSSHPRSYGCVIFPTGVRQVDIIGGGSGGSTGATNAITRVVFNADQDIAPVQTALTALSVSRMHAAYASGFTVGGAIGVGCYFMGGLDEDGSPCDEIYRWNQTTQVLTQESFGLPVALYGACAVYALGVVFIFGGRDSVGDDRVEIYRYNPGSTISELTTDLPAGRSFMAGFKDADGYIYLFGGQSGSDMVDTIYRFDPSSYAITEIAAEMVTSDEYGGYVEAPWTTKVGRWCGCLLQKQSTDTEWKTALVGGRLDSSSGEINTLTYDYDSGTQSIGPSGVSSYAYLYNNSAIDFRWAAQQAIPTVRSVVLKNWERCLRAFDPYEPWRLHDTLSAGNIARLDLEYPQFKDQKLYCGIMTGDGDPNGHTNKWYGFALRIWMRGSSVDDEPRTGYFVEYQGFSSLYPYATWKIGRKNGVGDETILWTESFYSSAGVLSPWGSAGVSFEFRVEGENPVRIYLNYNDAVTAEIIDPYNDRIMDVGDVCCITVSNVEETVLYFYSLNLTETGTDNEILSLSACYKGEAADASPYDRITLVPRSYSDAKSATRFVSTYFQCPTVEDWVWRKCRLKLGESRRRYREEGLYAYSRLYKHDQTLHIAGVHLQRGSMIPSSYMPTGYARETEQFSWEQALDPNNFRVKFRLLPTANFTEFTTDWELLRISIDANNYIRLFYDHPTDFNAQNAREYNVGADYTSQEDAGTMWSACSGPHDPLIKLEKVRGGSVVATLSMISYFGYSNLAEESCEATVDPLDFTIAHGPEGLELAIDRYGSEGRKFTSADLTPFTGSAADIVYKGVGYFTRPEIFDYITGRRGRLLPAKRVGALGKSRNKQRHQLLAGDRDPMLGDGRGQYFYEMGGLVLGVGDSFTRANASSVGGKFAETGLYGFSISGNKVVMAPDSAEPPEGNLGVVRWKQFPKHADYKLKCQARIAGRSNLFMLIGRWDWQGAQGDFGPYTGYTGSIDGYGIEIQESYPTAGTIQVRLCVYYHYRIEPGGYRQILAYENVANPGVLTDLWISFNGDTITGQFGNGTILTATNNLWPRAGYVGFSGSTMGTPTQSGGAVECDGWYMYPNFPNTYE